MVVIVEESYIDFKVNTERKEADCTSFVVKVVATSITVGSDMARVILDIAVVAVTPCSSYLIVSKSIEADIGV